MPGVTYGTGALIAGERNDRHMWSLHAGFLMEEVVPVVGAPVLAEAWRGGLRQASLARMLVGCDVEDMTTARARKVGELAGRCGIDDIVDVAVVEGAHRRGDGVVVTSNPSDIRQVAEAVPCRFRIEVV